MSPPLDIAAIVSGIHHVLPAENPRAALHEPWFCGNEWNYVKECLDTGWVSTAGKYVGKFESMLAGATGARHAIAVVNGTAALHVCLQLGGVRNGDEVLAPSLTFIATANAIAYCNATPHFVDSCLDTLGLDPHKLADYLADIAEIRGDECFNRKSGARISAVVPMHTFGHPVDMDPLIETAARYRIAVIEDAAESLGSYYKGRHTGNDGLLSALSFNGNKIVTTGGGGAILTNDRALAERARHITTTARVAHRWSFLHDEVGYNYRLPNLNAALGCAQLEKLAGFVASKRRLAARYQDTLSGIGGLTPFCETSFAKSNYWLNVLLLDASHAGERDALLEALNNDGLMARPVWTLMHELPMFRDCPRMPLPVAEQLAACIVNVPSSPFLAMRQEAEVS